MFSRSSNLGKQGVWAFEIGSSDNIKSPKIIQTPSAAEYNDYDQYQEVTTDPSISHLDSVEVSQQEESSVSRRGDQLFVSYNLPHIEAEDGLQTPYQILTEHPPVNPSLSTRRNPPLQFPGQQFPQQHPQIIDVEEVDETGIGK